jgi:tetratricopeptide (TPR) repeat protein
MPLLPAIMRTKSTHSICLRSLLLLGCLLALTHLQAQVAASSSAHDQLQQLTTQLQQSPGDQALRERIIALALTLSRMPAVPEETERRMARGIAAFKDAKSIGDYKDAVTEFEKAALTAPWYADAYYNLGQARAKTEDYAGAAASLKLYLLAAPGAKDAAAAKTLMYEMEYKQEKANKQRSAAAANEQARAEKEEKTHTTMICHLDHRSLFEDEATTIELNEAQRSVVVHISAAHIRNPGPESGGWDGHGSSTRAQSIGPFAANFGNDTITFSASGPSGGDYRDGSFVINRRTGAFEFTPPDGVSTVWNVWHCH